MWPCAKSKLSHQPCKCKHFCSTKASTLLGSANSLLSVRGKPPHCLFCSVCLSAFSNLLIWGSGMWATQHPTSELHLWAQIIHTILPFSSSTGLVMLSFVYFCLVGGRGGYAVLFIRHSLFDVAQVAPKHNMQSGWPWTPDPPAPSHLWWDDKHSHGDWFLLALFRVYK